MFDWNNIVGYVFCAIIGGIAALLAAGVAPEGNVAVHTASFTLSTTIALGGVMWASRFPGDLSRVMLASVFAGSLAMLMLGQTAQEFLRATSPNADNTTLVLCSIGFALLGIVLAVHTRRVYDERDRLAKIRTTRGAGTNN